MPPNDLFQPNALALASFVASNSDHYNGEPTSGESYEHSQEHLRATALGLLDAPPDTPNLNIAYLTLLSAIQTASNLDVRLIDLHKALSSFVQSEPNHHGSGINPLMKRRGSHRLYSIALDFGHRLKSGAFIAKDALSTFGFWMIRANLTGWQPSGSSAASLKHASHEKQTSKRTLRAMRRAQESIEELIEVRGKFWLGHTYALASQTDGSNLQSDQAKFNRLFRRRFHNLFQHASLNSQAGSHSNETLSLNRLKAIGQELSTQVLAGDLRAIHECLECITHLPSATVSLLPMGGSNQLHNKTLAWIDHVAGTYNYHLFFLSERGAKPLPETEALYVQTTALVTIKLPEFLTDAIAQAASIQLFQTGVVKDFLGDHTRDPRANLQAGDGFKTTVRKIQDSVPTHLIANGAHRFLVSLATSSPYLVSKGRSAYGFCKSSDIQATVDQAYSLLGWPSERVACSLETEVRLIGSRVTPSVEAVEKAATVLSVHADQASANKAETWRDLTNALNAHTAWLCFFIAFCLALRKANSYDATILQLSVDSSVSIHHKESHAAKSPQLPVVAELNVWVKSWLRYCRRVAEKLLLIGDPKSQEIAKAIKQWLEAADTNALFEVTVDGRLVRVGDKTWRNALPKRYKLVANFGRHFWPSHLIEKGALQSQIDLLLRHQLELTSQASAVNARRRVRDLDKLKSIISSVLSEMRLSIPREFNHE